MPEVDGAVPPQPSRFRQVLGFRGRGSRGSPDAGEDGGRGRGEGTFDGDTPEEVVAGWIDRRAAAGDAAALVPLLAERHPLHRGRSSNGTLRLRGWLLAAFEHAGLPEAAVAPVLAELESGREPYLVAAAARALRGLAQPDPGLVPFLLAAAHNVALHDDAVSFRSFRPSWPLEGATTATAEVFRTLGDLGAAAAPRLPELRARLADPRGLTARGREALARAIRRIEGAGPVPPEPASEAPAPPDAADDPSCCSLPPAWLGARRFRSGRRRSAWRLGGVGLQDQAGEGLGYLDFFAAGKPSVVAFFYTRCPNPERCSLTVTRLAALQRRLAAEGLEGVRVAALTYDPGFDLPARLHGYGANRGFRFAPDHRFLRVTEGWEALDRHFGLGVNHAGSIVNRHRVELFVVDGDGRIAARFEHLQWREDEVVEAVRRLGGARRTRGAASGALAAVAPLALVLMPKCPLCWMAWLGAVGLAGTWGRVATPGLSALFAALLALQLGLLARRAVLRGGWMPFALSLAGAALVAASWLAEARVPGVMGVLCLAGGAVLNGLPAGVLRRFGARWSGPGSGSGRPGSTAGTEPSRDLRTASSRP